MRTVFVVCEGQTEETFISHVVAPALYPDGVSLVAQLILTSPGHKGGALSYERVARHLRNELRRGSAPVVTTLFDLYALGNDFPGYALATGLPLSDRLMALNVAFHADIVARTGCRSDCFIPYLQPYEFEALLFSDVVRLTGLEEDWSAHTEELRAIRDAVESPEHINDGPTTHPSAHLGRLLTSPRYRKALHGPRAADAIGLERMADSCPCFAGWLARLRVLGA